MDFTTNPKDDKSKKNEKNGNSTKILKTNIKMALKTKKK